MMKPIKPYIHVQDLPFFNSVLGHATKEIRLKLKRITCDPGQIIFQEGDAGDKCLFILDGQVEILKKMTGSSNEIIGIRRAGEIIGEMSLFDPMATRSATIRSKSKAMFAEMTHSDLISILKTSPQVAFQVISSLTSRIRESDDHMIQSLRIKNANLEKAYHELREAQAQLVEKEKLERELELAKEIQSSILPSQLPELTNVRFGGHITQAKHVGGDFYNIIKLKKDKYAVVIGDVSGKGIPAAIFMASVNSLIQMAAYQTEDPVQVLENVNAVISPENDTGMFATIIYGILNVPKLTFTFARAGHDMPVLIRENGDIQIPELKTSHAIGVLDQPELDTHTLNLTPGATLFLYTDGVTETVSLQQEQFGIDRLLINLKHLSKTSPQRLCDQIVSVVLSFGENQEQFDDITALSIQIRS